MASYSSYQLCVHFPVYVAKIEIFPVTELDWQVSDNLHYVTAKDPWTGHTSTAGAICISASRVPRQKNGRGRGELELAANPDVDSHGM